MLRPHRSQITQTFQRLSRLKPKPGAVQMRYTEGMEKYPLWVYVVGIVAMVAFIVVVDFAFFRDHFWARLAVNIGIVLVFAAFYLRFLK
jgi:hypothetical protein